MTRAPADDGTVGVGDGAADASGRGGGRDGKLRAWGWRRLLLGVGVSQQAGEDQAEGKALGELAGSGGE